MGDSMGKLKATIGVESQVDPSGNYGISGPWDSKTGTGPRDRLMANVMFDDLACWLSR
jgi:hypothetical protein